MEMLGYGTINARAARRGMRRDPFAVVGTVFGICALVGMLSVQPGALDARVTSDAVAPTVHAALTVRKDLAAAAQAGVTLSGRPSRPPFIATATGTTGTISALQHGFERGASVAGGSSVVASLAIEKSLAATATGASFGQAVIFKGLFGGSVNAAARASGLLTVQNTLQASVDANAQASSVLSISKPLQATATGIGAVTPTLMTGTPLGSTIVSQANVTGDIVVGKPLTAQASAQATSAATLLIVKRLVGDAYAQSSITALLTSGGMLNSTAAGVPAVSAALTVSKVLAANPSGLASATGTTTIRNALLASVSGLGNLNGDFGDSFYRLAETGSRRIREGGGVRVRDSIITLRLTENGARRVSEAGKYRTTET